MLTAIRGNLVFVAVCSFEGCEPGDLSFEEGDYITLIAKVLAPPTKPDNSTPCPFGATHHHGTWQGDPGWWQGTCNGLTGVFPCNHVEPVDASLVQAASYNPTSATTYNNNSSSQRRLFFTSSSFKCPLMNGYILMMINHSQLKEQEELVPIWAIA